MRARLAGKRARQRGQDAELRVNELFYSIQGESVKAGLPTVFIRLSGCPLRCRYCDTAYAFHAGQRMHVKAIIRAVARHRARHVTVTGGEPLAQRACLPLLRQLCDEGFQVSLETGGAHDIAGVDGRVMKVMDIKTPGSGEDGRNRLANLAWLTRRDQIKFVICDRADYDWCRQKLNEHKLTDICEVLFSPEHESLAAVELAEWILADQLNVRLQLQLHKYLWGDGAGH